jgi:hypothetical protein
MPRYVQFEIDQVRREARTKVSSETASTEGVSREAILDFLSAADLKIARKIVNETDSCELDTTQTISLVDGIREYTLNFDMFGPHTIRLVEYSFDGDNDNYEPIFPTSLTNLYTSESTDIENYAIRGNSIIVSPVPSNSTGKLRITYPRRPDRLEVRRGKVSSVTSDGTYYLTIVLENDSTLDESLFSSYEFLTINESDGDVVRYSLKYSSYNSSTRTFTLPANTVLVSQGTITSSHYVCVGDYSTTHSKLPRECDDYRIAYGVLQVMKTRSNVDINEEAQILAMLEADIIPMFRGTPKGPRAIIPINPFWT